MPGVRESLETFVGTLLEFYKEDGNIFLRIKQDGGQVKPEVMGILENFLDYKENLAKYILNHNIGGVKSLVEARGAVATAWNFLSIGNVMESADLLRIGGGDKIRTMMRPLDKAFNKWKIGKGAMTGEEENFGGSVGSWMLYKFETNPNFREKLKKGYADGSLRPFPVRMGVGMLEVIDVETETGEKVKLAEALMNRTKIKTKYSEAPLLFKFSSLWGASMDAFNYAIGKNILEYGKNSGEWVAKLGDTLASLRSMKVLKGDRTLRFVDDPEYMVWVIANSIGLKKTQKLVMNIPGNWNYGEVIRQIVMFPGLIYDKRNASIIRDKLSSSWLDRWLT
jgi:hypothetical protein